MSEVAEGYVPSMDEFQQMAKVMDREHRLFEGRIIQGRMINGAFIADREEDREALADRAREDLKSLGREV